MSASASAPAPAQQLPADIPLRRDAPSGAAGPAGSGLSTVAGALVLLGVIAFALLRGRNAARGARGSSAAGMAGHPPRPGAGSWADWKARLTGGAAGAAVQVSGGQRITPRHSVHVVTWRGDEYLIACSDNGVSVVDSKPVSADTARVDARVDGSGAA